MRTLRNLVLGLLVLLGIAAAVAYAFRGQIAMSLVERQLKQNLTGDPIAALPDGLHVALCGTGSPMQSADRSGPCVAVIAGKRFIVIDAGSGASRVLARMNLPPGRIDEVLLTHFHSDHIDGLGELMMQRWVGGAHTAPLPVHGPEGVESVVEGFNAAYELDKGYRVAHHGEKTVPPGGAGGTPNPITLDAEGEAIVLEEGDLRIVAFKVDHAPIEPAVGYKVTYKGRSAVISGDTKPNALLEREAQGVDLLVHEALSPKLVGLIAETAKNAGRPNIAKLMTDIPDYHTSPEDAAGIAQRARVKMLLLYHIVPLLPLSALEGPFLGKAPEIYTGPLHLGRDGDIVSMPAKSQEITFGSRF